MLSEAWHVFSEPAHALAEAWSTGVEFVIIGLANWAWHKRHDRKHHGQEAKEEINAVV